MAGAHLFKIISFFPRVYTAVGQLCLRTSLEGLYIYAWGACSNIYLWLLAINVQSFHIKLLGNIAKYYIFWWKFSFTICIWFFRLEHVVKKDIDMNELLREFKECKQLWWSSYKYFLGGKKRKNIEHRTFYMFSKFFSFVQLQNGNLASKILINQSQLN